MSSLEVVVVAVVVAAKEEEALSDKTVDRVCSKALVIETKEWEATASEAASDELASSVVEMEAGVGGEQGK